MSSLNSASLLNCSEAELNAAMSEAGAHAPYMAVGALLSRISAAPGAGLEPAEYRKLLPKADADPVSYLVTELDSETRALLKMDLKALHTHLASLAPSARTELALRLFRLCRSLAYIRK